MMHLLRQYLHLRDILVKTLAISQCNYTTLIGLGHLGQYNTNRNNPIRVTSPKVVKASRDGKITCQYC
jgi:hypothetical protein